MQIRIEYVHFGIGNNIRTGDFPNFSGYPFNVQSYRPNVIYLRFVRRRNIVRRHLNRSGFQTKLLEIQDNVCYILANSGKCGKFMQNAVNFYRRDRRTFQRRKQHTTQTVSDRYAVTAFERLTDKFAVTSVFTDFNYLNFRFFNIYHQIVSSLPNCTKLFTGENSVILNTIRQWTVPLPEYR